jgi:hypothetical protein
MTVFAGDVISAADINGIIALVPQTYTKSASTSRISTTTYADDPHLASIPLAIGTYEIELVGFFTLTTTATQKIKTQWKFTGTWNTPIRACYGPGFAQVAGPASCTESNFSASVADSGDAIYDVSAGGTFCNFLEKARNVTVSVAGNLSLSWAPQANVANNTTLQVGTSFTIRKLQS